MEGTLFWLVPVLLGVAVALLLRQRPKRKNTLTLVEPLGWLMESWHLARFIDDKTEGAKLWWLLKRTEAEDSGPLEELIRHTSLKSQVPEELELLEVEGIGALSRRYILQSPTGSKRSVVVGPPCQLQGYLADKDHKRYLELARQSAKQGFLAIAIADCFIHGPDRKKAHEHELVDLALLEPVMHGERQKALKRETNVKFLTVLPDDFACHIFETHNSKTCFAIDAPTASRLFPPSFAEAELEKAHVIGNADLRLRHQALRTFERKFDCAIVSNNHEDKHLPVAPVTALS